MFISLHCLLILLQEIMLSKLGNTCSEVVFSFVVGYVSYGMHSFSWGEENLGGSWNNRLDSH